mgnify:CR=1 FL=1
MGIKFQYTTMIVNNMKESVKFYTEVMGFSVDSTYAPTPDTSITLICCGGDAMIELIQNKAFETGLHCIGMDVDNLDETLVKLRENGTEITMEPIPTLVGKMAFAKDPNGVKIALIEHNR